MYCRLRYDPWYRLSYCSDIRIEVAHNIGYPSVYCWHTPGKLTSIGFNFAGTKAVKALQWLLLWAAYVILLCPNSILDSTRGRLVGPRHKRTRHYSTTYRSKRTKLSGHLGTNPRWESKEDTQIQFEEFQDKCNTAIQQYNIYSMMK